MKFHITNDQWLKDQCNRYKNGRCQTLSCLKRGGYDRVAPVCYDIATCEAHEVLCELESLREECRLLDRDLSDALDPI